MNYQDESFTTHQPRTVYDSDNGTMNHFWDANGNLAQVVDCNHNAARLHEWDEENRLRFVLGEKYAGYYGYDANGERVYKLTGSSSMDDVNSGSIKAQAIFDDAVLYPNPYIVVTPKGYTKHYYAGTERLATAIGGGGFLNLQTPIVPLTSQHDMDIVKSLSNYYLNEDPFNYQQIINKSEPTEDILGNENPDLEYQCQPTELVLVDVYTSQDILLGSISSSEPVFSEETDVYFYHGDHLGSASWITDDNGKPIQYIHYAPYGELIANQQTIGYDERYKFTGKERDWETGYDYFGARFYDYRKGFWNSVDPLADKNISNSPYMYCSGNPIMSVDLDGRDDYEINWNSETKKVTIYQIKNKKNDQVHIVDANGNRIASSKQYDYRTITKLRSGKWEESNLSLFDVKGDDNAESLFQFLGSNFTKEKDSPLEWSRVMVGTSKSGRNIIGTSMKEDATGVGHYIMFHGYTIRGVDHNHPRGSGPSNTDIENARHYHLKFPKAILRVFANGIYVYYDENTPKRLSVSVELGEIEVIGIKK